MKETNIYNGYKNFETWLYALHYDENIADMASALKAESKREGYSKEDTIKKIAGFLRNELLGIYESDLYFDSDGFKRDLLNYCIDSIDFYSIAKNEYEEV